MAEYTERRVYLPLKTTSYGWPLCYCCDQPMRALPDYKWDCRTSKALNDFINAGVGAAVERAFERELMSR